MSEEKREQKTAVSDIENYADLSRGFASIDEANAAVQAFWEDFYALRNKHRLADVHVIVRVVIQDDDRSDAMLSMHAGSDVWAESMCAWAYGHETAQRQGRILKMMESAAKAIRGVKNKR